MSTNTKVIEIQNLTKYYGKRRGVKDISLSVDEGDIFGFLGPNGSGKSTTIRSMLGLLRFQKGQIRLLQKDSLENQTDLLREIGYMPSEAMFYPAMRAEELIHFSARARGLDCSEEADRLCRLLEIDKKKKIGELSLGNRKKISIVCAMQHKPRLLILDEPTSGLDPLMQELFFGLVLEYNQKGTTCFLSSHILSEVKRYCKNAAIIKDGTLIRQDSVENLTRSHVRRVKIVLADREEEFVYTGNMQDLIHRLDGMNVQDVLIEEPGLDEIFMHYYREEEEK